MNNEKVIGTQLGRFAPYQLGHQKGTQAVLDLHGPENSLVLIGSSNKVDRRTPFTFEQRARMIQTIFSDVRVLPLPDIDPSRASFDNSTLPAWIAQIKSLQEELGAKLKFYGGSEEDIKYLKEDFDAEILVDRDKGRPELRATTVRGLLEREDYLALYGLIDDRIVDQVISDFRLNLETILTQ